MRFRSLICLALIHVLVDSYAQVIAPLWPRMEKDLELSPWLLTLMYGAWQMATSVSQPLFGYWGDRFGSRWMLGVGPGLAVVCVSLLGFAAGPASLVLLLALGGLGVGAFHPEAAAEVVHVSGAKLTKGLALFSFGGMVGLGIGPIVSGTVVERYGLRALIWLLPVGLMCLGVLFWLRRAPAQRLQPRAEPAGLVEIVGGQWLAVILLLTVATLRVVPVLGIPLALAFLLDQQSRTAAEIGWSQSLFLWSGGLGTLLCPMFVRPGRELAALVGTMLPATGCMMLLAWNRPGFHYVGLVGSGLLLQGAIPILIAYSQRLLPRGQRLGASLTLGASWGLGGLFVAVLQGYFKATGHVAGMFWAMVPFALAATVGSCLLPRLPASLAPAAESRPVAV